MHRALRVPELLNLILSQALEKTDYFHVSLTCTLWTDRAFDHLWRELRSLRPLFALLAPLRKVCFAVWEFTSPFPPLYDWSRFNFYAKRVQSLHLTIKRAEFASSAYAVISQFKQSIHLLPNLREVHLDEAHSDTAIPISLFALGPTVHTFTYAGYLESSEEHNQNTVMELLHRRVPSLQTLKLTAGTDKDLLSKCVRAFGKLRHLTVADQLIDPSLWDSLSSRPQLESMVLPHCTMTADVIISDGGFPALKSLEVGATMEDWLKLLESGTSPSKLLKVQMTVFNVQRSTPTAQALFRAAATSFRQITDLSVHLEWKGYAITFDSFKDLLSCRSLKNLSLSHSWGVDITKDELVEVLKALPDLRILLLEKRLGRRNLLHLGETDSSRLGIDTLDLFAAHCPNIQDLTLNFSNTIPVIHVPDLLPHLRNLQSLNVGFSDVGDVEAVAMYLAHRVDRSTTLSMAKTWEHEPDARTLRWERVRGLTRVLFAQRDLLERQREAMQGDCSQKR